MPLYSRPAEKGTQFERENGHCPLKWPNGSIIAFSCLGEQKAVFGEGLFVLGMIGIHGEEFGRPGMIGALERLAAGASGDLGEIGVGTAEFGPTMVCLPLIIL